MPVAPDIDYYLMGSEQFCHLGVDAAFYFRYIAEDANAYIDAYDKSKRVYPYRRHMDTLRDMGVYCEERFVRWRQTGPEAAPACSRRLCDSFSAQIEEYCHDTAMGLVNHSIFSFNRRAQIQLAERDFDQAVAVMRRSVVRAWHDLDGYRGDTMEGALALCDTIFERSRLNDAEARQAIMERVRWDEENDPEYGGEPLDVVLPPPKKTTLIERKRKIRLRRATTKRSIRLVERFIGAEPVRLFIGGDAMTVTGQLATYKITRRRNILAAHGGAELGVYSLDGQTKLCRLCIYTANVPLLDHVLSLILHIRAGQEDHILKTGNPYDITDEGRATEWLQPYLPPPRTGSGGRGLFPGDMPPVYRADDRELRIAQVRRDIAEVVLDRLGQYCPPMPQTQALLLSGLPRREFVQSQEALPFLAERPEAALLPACV